LRETASLVVDWLVDACQADSNLSDFLQDFLVQLINSSLVVLEF
jgi:hypothetical protein